MNMRVGRYVLQPEGFSSFVPNRLPPQDPPLTLDLEMLSLLSKADLALGRLDGIAQTLPNPDLFVSMYVRKEALLSSQIEGNQASLKDLLEAKERQTPDAREVNNYVDALNHGLQRLREEDVPLSLRLLCEIHAKLMATGRGSTLTPGEFRKSPNWIGAPGSTPSTATFIPPTVHDMHQVLGDLEAFLCEEDGLSPLVKIALIHAQFETIHPFVDGNGRMGRLLMTLWLCHQGILSHPLLCLSCYLKRNRTEYYDRLMDIRTDGKWEAWVKFFLRGIHEISCESTASVQEANALRDELVTKLCHLNASVATNAKVLLDHLFVTPQVTRASVSQTLGVSGPTAGALIKRFERLNVLEDSTPESVRNKRYVFRRYLDILKKGT